MSLTPSTVRTDLKCGKGAVRPGQKCTKGRATAVENALKIGGLVGGLGSFAYGLHQASKGELHKAHQGFAGAHGFLAVSATGVGLQGRRTKNKAIQRTARRMLSTNAALAGANLVAGRLVKGSVDRQRLERIYNKQSAKRDSFWAEGFQP